MRNLQSIGELNIYAWSSGKSLVGGGSDLLGRFFRNSGEREYHHNHSRDDAQ